MRSGIMERNKRGKTDKGGTVQKQLQEKYQKLCDYLRQFDVLAVCFSGGVDSSLLLRAAHDVAGKRAFTVTELNPFFPQKESMEAQELCEQLGVVQLRVSHKLDDFEGVAENPQNRCYVCKKQIFLWLQKTADEYAVQQGLLAAGEHVTLLEGSNASDASDYRPGHKAVVELGALSPLEAVGLSKGEIREISKELGLPTWNKPSFACLASRFEYGQLITAELLARVEAAERLFFDEGFAQVRVRVSEQGAMARIELEAKELQRGFAFLQERAARELHRLGFAHVALDVDGYRTGSMNVGIAAAKTAGSVAVASAVASTSAVVPAAAAAAVAGACEPADAPSPEAARSPEDAHSRSIRLSRTELLLGKAALDRLAQARVAVFGVGGVGGYVVEALARTGVGALDLIDNDVVSLSNLNRQIIATTETLGQAKVKAAAARVHQINPSCKVTTHQCFFLPENADQFDFSAYDYVVDAVDTVTAKLEIIQRAQAAGVPVISSMGAGNKLDPTAFRVADLYQTSVDKLAKVMRRECKKRGIQRVKVVYSTEEAHRACENAPQTSSESGAKRVPGSVAYVPSACGLTIAAEVIRCLCEQA